MGDEVNSKKIRICILAGSLFFMCYVAMAAAIADIAAFFPSYSVQVIQTGVTAINLVGVFGALASGWLSFRYSKKLLIVIGLALVSAGGAGGFFFHSSLTLFYAWSFVIGAGLGMFQPLVASLLADYFEGKERNQLAGVQTSFVSGGGVAMAFIGGVLAAVMWHFSYLAFLIAIPILVICVINLPTKNRYSAEKGAKVKMPRCVYYYFVTVFLFMMVYNTFPSNIALYLSEKGFGTASLAGVINAVFMFGGVFMGLVFSRFSLRIGEYLFGISYAALVLSFVLLCVGQHVVLVFIAAFVGGMSVSMTMPQAMFSVSMKIPPAASAAVFSLMATISPCLGTFVSPTVIAFFSGAVSGAGDSISRFTAGIVLGAVFAAGQFVITARSRRAERAAEKAV